MPQNNHTPAVSLNGSSSKPDTTSVSPEVTPKKARRNFSAAQKLKILSETDGLATGELGAYVLSSPVAAQRARDGKAHHRRPKKTCQGSGPEAGIGRGISPSCVARSSSSITNSTWSWISSVATSSDGCWLNGSAASWPATLSERPVLSRGSAPVRHDPFRQWSGHDLKALAPQLSLSKSFTRPYTSNDNPFSESQFKTVKYHPLFPGRFGSF